MISNLADESLPGNGQMSELGQSRRSDRAPVPSVLPRKADKFRARWRSAFVPQTDSCTAANNVRRISSETPQLAWRAAFAFLPM